jgi:hypothetical protein
LNTETVSPDPALSRARALARGARKAKADMERKRRARTPMRTSFQCSRRTDAMSLDGSFSRVGREGVDMDGLLSDRETAIG